MAREMEDEGQVTIKTEDGESVTIKPEEGDNGEGSVTVESDEGKLEMNVSEDEGETVWKMTDEDGETTISSVTQDVSEADVGVKFYPGAEVEHGSKASTTADEGGSWSVVVLTTKDSVDKVAGFYKKHYADGSQVIEAADTVHIIMAASGAEGKTVTITRDDDESVTRIAITAGSR